MVGFAGRAHYLGAARRALLRHLEFSTWALVLRILRLGDLHDLGDDVAAALDLHPIADADAEALDLVGFGERCFPGGAAADADGLEVGGGGELAGASDGDADVHDARDAAARRPLEG